LLTPVEVLTPFRPDGRTEYPIAIRRPAKCPYVRKARPNSTWQCPGSLCESCYSQCRISVMYLFRRDCTGKGVRKAWKRTNCPHPRRNLLGFPADIACRLQCDGFAESLLDWRGTAPWREYGAVGQPPHPVGVFRASSAMDDPISRHSTLSDPSTFIQQRRLPKQGGLSPSVAPRSSDHHAVESSRPSNALGTADPNYLTSRPQTKSALALLLSRPRVQSYSEPTKHIPLQIHPGTRLADCNHLDGPAAFPPIHPFLVRLQHGKSGPKGGARCAGKLPVTAQPQRGKGPHTAPNRTTARGPVIGLEVDNFPARPAASPVDCPPPPPPFVRRYTSLSFYGVRIFKTPKPFPTIVKVTNTT